MRMQLWLLGFVGIAGACTPLPTTAMVDGALVPRPNLEFAGQPYTVRHSAAHPRPGGASSGLRDAGGKISGQVCGMDIEYEVQHVKDHVQLVGFVDQSYPSQIQVRDLRGERVITGAIGNLAVDVRLRSNQVIGRVGFRYFDLRQEGDRLAGPLRITGTDDPTTATMNGRDALWAMPPADQAAVLPNLLTCFVATIGTYGRSPLKVGFGGRAGALPHESSALYGEGQGIR